MLAASKQADDGLEGSTARLEALHLVDHHDAVGVLSRQQLLHPRGHSPAQAAPRLHILVCVREVDHAGHELRLTPPGRLWLAAAPSLREIELVLALLSSPAISSRLAAPLDSRLSPLFSSLLSLPLSSLLPLLASPRLASSLCSSLFPFLSEPMPSSDALERASA
eukprot:CAMPEP_0182825244 /NCGR_PEP_ID=MMETSP0006_2-20121128/15729_1 /TAXON_ID=97485 /ORGANISM="Prymnesium parvum, Strain Texoma1" /LENGTH=164 /DNA_ID=CAMNT_0024952313 /DNA_START=262 /DNA_END=753 /DNA_ORIENTATION=-